MKIPVPALLSTAVLFCCSACHKLEQSDAEPIDAPVAGAVSASALGGFQWTLVELEGAGIEVPEGRETPHLVFLDSGQRVAGSTGCNRIMGSCSISEDGKLELATSPPL